jgi:hypothetical protein
VAKIYSQGGSPEIPRFECKALGVAAAISAEGNAQS